MEKNQNCGNCGQRINCEDKPQSECRFWQAEEHTTRDESESLSGETITEEMPQSTPTTDFNLYRLPHFAEELKFVMAKVCAYLSDYPSGAPTVTIKLRFPEGFVKTNIVLSLPNDIKLELDDVAVIRENGTIRLEATQSELFKEAS